jgi:hypothetical protein
MKVPAGQTVWIKSRKFVEGEELPGGVYMELEKPPAKKPAKQIESDGDEQ